MAIALSFNLISSLLVWHPEGQLFNTAPMTVEEWICDIISIVMFLTGIQMMILETMMDKDSKEDKGSK